MSSFGSPGPLERRNNAATVKKAMLEKFRAARLDPAFEQQRLKRITLNEARAARTAEREAAKKARAVELAAQAARAAELAAQAQREAEKAEALAKARAAERDAALVAEQKGERDARYAARKAAKKSGGAGTSGFRSMTAIQCPLWVISGQTNSLENPPMSALVQKRTNAGAVGMSAKCHKRTSSAYSFHLTIDGYLARFQVTVPTPPLDAVAVTYLSSSLFAVTIERFCSVPFQFGNVALSTLKIRVLSAGLTE
jgi:multidrug efflux pump subunit AcrA (membrane-fusion protein)